MIKTKEEIEIIREGGKRLAWILSAIRDAIKPGITTRELDQLAEKLMRDGGDEPSFLHYTPEGMTIPYPSSLCVSVNDEITGKPKSFILSGVWCPFGIRMQSIPSSLATSASWRVSPTKISFSFGTPRSSRRRKPTSVFPWA